MVFPCVGLSFRTDSTVLPQSLTRDKTIRGATIPVGDAELTYTTYEPYGVVAAITPWNYPASNFATKVAPILACGNTVVVKPAEQTPLVPLVPLRLAELADQAGLPPGVVNVVTGDGPTAGAALAGHPRVPKVAFTGSSATGRQLMAHGTTSITSFTSFTLELGGKTASLVLPEADLDAAADAIVHTAFVNSGQTCTAGSRVLVHREAHDALLERVGTRTRALRVGDPRDERTHVGAIISAEQLDRIVEYAELAKSEATVVVGGDRLHPAGFEDGWWFAPTVVDGVAPTSRLFREEIFGPLLTVTTYADLDEGIALVNDTEYGLAATVWGTRQDQVRRAVRQLDAGIVWANTVHRLHPAVPYGGRRQSGVGLELGVEAQYEYMRPKTVWQGDTGWRSPWA
ncbi:MAG: aldehyde dehydrogenase family protein [Streptosporangiales bacterium]|nr:aldehyde dehydrogenase family protein [Streptosporangiales bacterium]